MKHIGNGMNSNTQKGCNGILNKNIYKISKPLTRTYEYIHQSFNLIEGGQLVSDLYEVAVNFKARTG